MKKLPEPELEDKANKKRGDSADGKPRKKGIFEKLAEKMEEVQRQQDVASGRKTSKPAQQASPDGMKQAKKSKKRQPKTGG